MASADERIEKLLARVAERINAHRTLPESTYRLQFHSGFTFRDALEIVPYLHELGVTHCYVSPYLQARPGSKHGYDIIDHSRLNHEIGSGADYEAWVAALHERGMGQILDVVPNHMGIHGHDNRWWTDVLENGPASVYSAYFDIGWHSSPRPELNGRVLIPILGDPYGKVLESGQLRLFFQDGAFTVYYFEHAFPIDPSTYDLILDHRVEELEHLFAADDPALLEYRSIVTAISHLPDHSVTEPELVAERQREKEVIKRRLAQLVTEAPAVGEFLRQTVAQLNGQPGDRHSFDRLSELLDRQAYRLSFWRVASDEINYRRFFDVNDLAALNMERSEVFDAAHKLVLRLLVEGKVDGVRIDHPDGLYDPRQYLQRLQQHFVLIHARRIVETDLQFARQNWDELEPLLRDEVAQAVREGQTGPLWRPLYVVVEKIVGSAEELPTDWSIHGTTGYDFLTTINGLFIDADNGPKFTQLYQQWTQNRTSFGDIVYESKLLILRTAVASELQMLSHHIDRIAQKDRWSRDFTLNSLRHALRELLAGFPVYRSYISDTGVRDDDRRFVNTAMRRATARNPTTGRFLFRFIRDVLLLQYADDATDLDKADQRRFAGKFQQVSAPVMAKGLEDTAFYNYNRLVSLNEVGGNPDRFGTLPENVHYYLSDRKVKWPFALSPLSTHDTKRSEDVRSRLNVLSELADEWAEAVPRWSEMNRSHRQVVDELSVPDANEEYMLYQTLLGAWPLEPYTKEGFTDFINRTQSFMVKALHEAKVHSSWINPDEEYDNAARDFIGRILCETNAAFLNEFRPFQRRIAHFGMLNSLSQTLVRIAAPGVPDTYQGTELWDFSLVDPDNRRPVNYECRRRMLREIQSRWNDEASRGKFVSELLDSKEDGRVKLFLVWRLLNCRRDYPALFSSGEYVPIDAAGQHAANVFSFLRRSNGHTAIAVAPRLMTRLVSSESGLPLGQEVWGDTRLNLKGVIPSSRFRNMLTGEELAVADPAIAVADVLRTIPVALLLSSEK